MLVALVSSIMHLTWRMANSSSTSAPVIPTYGTQTFNYGLLSIYSAGGVDAGSPLVPDTARPVFFGGGQTVTNDSRTNNPTKFIVTGTPITIMNYIPNFALIPSGHATITGSATFTGQVTVAAEPYITVLCAVSWFNPDNISVVNVASNVLIRLDTGSGASSFITSIPFSLDLVEADFSPTDGIGIFCTVTTSFTGVNLGIRTFALVVQEIASTVKTP